MRRCGWPCGRGRPAETHRVGREPQARREIRDRRGLGAEGGRGDRSAAGRALDPGAIGLAVAASVRHRDTAYDQLLMSGHGRSEARLLVRDEVDRRLEAWRDSPI